MATSQYGGMTPLGDGLLSELARIVGYDRATAEPRRRVLTPAQRLMCDVLHQAIDESENATKMRDRNGARAWLRMQPGFTARECCEALGLEYGAVMDAMERRWKSAS